MPFTHTWFRTTLKFLSLFLTSILYIVFILFTKQAVYLFYKTIGGKVTMLVTFLLIIKSYIVVLEILRQMINLFLENFLKCLLLSLLSGQR